MGVELQLRQEVGAGDAQECARTKGEGCPKGRRVAGGEVTGAQVEQEGFQGRDESEEAVKEVTGKA